MGRYIAWPPPEELTELLARAQHADTGARDRLLAALRTPLLAFFSYRLPNDVAEDLTQTALIRITRAIPRIDLARADRYVSTVARNVLRTAYRRRIRDGRRSAGASFVDLAESPVALDLDLEYRELAEAVRDVSARCLPPQLAQIVLGLLEGQTAAEIAQAQGVSPITIRTRLARARVCLRRELRPYLERAKPGERPTVTAGPRTDRTVA